MSEEKEYLTPEKFNEFKLELEDLKTNKRKEVAENLEYSKSLGDLSENAEYHQAREMQANTEERIAKLEHILKTAEIVSTHDTNCVTMGSVVTVQKNGGDKQTYTIVGSEETDMVAKKISNRSPLGEALVGKKVGETFKFKSPIGEVSYKVLKIE